MSDPYARALSAIEALFSPDLGPVALEAWREAREAIWDAQDRHAALTEELRALREAMEPTTVTEDTRNVFEADGRDANEPDMNGIELLETLHLLPDEPLPIQSK